MTFGCRHTEKKKQKIHIFFILHSIHFSLSSACVHTVCPWLWMRPSTYKSEHVWCENRGTTPHTSENDTSAWYVGRLSQHPHVPDATFLSSGGLQSCQVLSCQEITFGLLAAACSPSPDCVWGWRGKSVSAMEIRLKSQTLGIFILHVGIVSTPTALLWLNTGFKHYILHQSILYLFIFSK